METDFKILYISKWQEYMNKYGNDITALTLMLFKEEDLKRMPFDKDFYLEVYNFKVKIDLTNKSEIHSFLEYLFRNFNCEENPLANPDKQKLIRDNNRHTSMSVGDLVLLGEKLYIVASIGFIEVKDENIKKRFL